MTLIQFLITYFFFVGLGTLTVSGWFFITRGREEKLPDGSIQKKTVNTILLAWLFTLPVTSLMAAGIYVGLSYITKIG